MSRQPEVLWAQRSDKVYLTISLPDARDISVKCEAEGLFTFSAVGVNGDPFNFTIQFYGNIAPQGCKTKTGLRNILCSIQKEQKGWWKRLLKSEEKPAPYIKVDWNKWCDEDDEESDLALCVNRLSKFLIHKQIWHLMMILSIPVKMKRAVTVKECFIFLIWRKLEVTRENQELFSWKYRRSTPENDISYDLEITILWTFISIKM